MIRSVAAAGFMALAMNSLQSRVEAQDVGPVPAFLILEAEETYAQDRED